MVLIMKKTLTLLSLVAVMVLVMAENAVAQKSKVRYADQQMGLMNYQHAVEVYHLAYEKKPTYETAQKIAEAYNLLRNYDSTYRWWETTVGYEEATRDDFIQFLNSAQLTDNLPEAATVLQEKGVAIDSLDMQMLLDVQSRRKVKVEPAEGLNSSGSDFNLTKDGSGNLYFVSDRGGQYSSKMPGIRIDGRNKIFSEKKQDYTDREYFSIYRRDSAGSISKVTPNVPDTYNFSDPSYAQEAGLLFYSVTRGITKEKKNRDVTVYPEIYYGALTEDGALEGITGVPFNDSTGYSVMNPFIDEESKRLYFVSDMPGGMGGTDLYYSTYDEAMTFSAPVNLGSPVNTEGNESHPFRKEDTFYFSSTGHAGVGGLDVFSADYSGTEIDNVQNMGMPINSRADDFAYRELTGSNDKPAIYISSNRKGGAGHDDIYSINDVYKQFLARVVDCDSIMISDSYLATLRDNTQNGDVQTQRNPDGALRAELEPDSDFGLAISKPGYFNITDPDISTKGVEEDTVKRVYALIPIPYQLPVYVDIVYYDLDKYRIREDAKAALDKLGELMGKYPFLDLLVSSYADARASDEYNIALSTNRAKAVTDYMAQYNIPAERIRLKWYGEENSVNDCGDGVPCSESEYQLDRRSELILEAFPDTGKQYDMPESLNGKNFCDPASIFEDLQEEIAQIPTIYFDFDKSMLRSVHKKELERTAILLKRLPNLNLYIEGHTDQRGSDEYNLSLSERRAEVVKEYLKNRGIEENRMEGTWFGESRPLHDCSEGTCTNAMHQLNRRTELRVGKSAATDFDD